MPRQLIRRSTVTSLARGLVPVLSLVAFPGLFGCSSTVEGKGGPSASTGGASTGGNGSGGDMGGSDSGGNAGSGGKANTGGGTNTGGNDGTGGDSGPTPPSCEDLPANCGPNENESCCASILLDSEPFPMGRSETAGGADLFANGDADEIPERTATPLGSIRLDKYEVTVGRYRRFLEAFPGNKPAPGDGAHPGQAGTGWKASWDDQLDEDQYYATLAVQCGFGSTWHDQPSTDYGDSELRPINCVSWFYAFAFCAWDGGFLPSELDWEFAAAGGSENRLYPWGDDAPAQSLASFDCAHAEPLGYCTDPDGLDNAMDIAFVGTLPDGAGRFGHHDLAGNMAEWVIDAYGANYYTAVPNCTNCINAMPDMLDPNNPTTGVTRGGSWEDEPEELRAAARKTHDLTGFDASDRATGFRCARSN